MARPRTPTNVLEIRGAFDKNPNRRREDAKTTGEIGDPPTYLSEMERLAWAEIVQNAPISVLTSADRQIVELASRLMAESRVDFTEFTAAKLARLEAMLGKLGMTPADRSRVSGGNKDKPRNAFSEL
jgi:phage terminase small subunit